MVNSTVYTIKLAGPAGAGVKSSGLLLSQVLLAHGYHLQDYSEYPSLVRGGHNTYQVSFSRQPIFSSHQQVNLFFSLQSGHWQQHQKEFSSTSLILGDDTVSPLPLSQLADSVGSRLYANSICLGVTTFLFKFDYIFVKQFLSHHFSTSPNNLQAFEIGYNYAKDNLGKYQYDLKYKHIDNSQIIVDGNEAFGWGFINAGGNFYAAYPMTPATGLLHFLAARQQKYQLTVVHPEDEIAAASMVVGAAYAGARSAVGTSGGGFALMTETVSFCGAANIGTVFYLSQRPGPATGLPTWTSQGDLLFAINSGHGEFNKIVLAPGDQLESYDIAVISLNLAAKFNLPVIVLTDKFISESSASVPDLSTKKTKVVVSQLGLRLANSYEHDGLGFSTEASSQIIANTSARTHQLHQIVASLPKPILYGNPQAKKLIISWGSTKGPILEAIKNNSQFAFLHLRSLWPIDPHLQRIIQKYRRYIVIENNATSQLTTLLRSQFDFHPASTLLKSDGRPFFPEDIIDFIHKS